MHTRVHRRGFLRVLGAGSVAALGLTGCGSAMPTDAVEAWRGPGAELAAQADPRLWILSYAILAPHSHNLQSWIVDLRERDHIHLYCDATRLLPETDPLSRQIMMSHGTFLEMLDLAARERGWRAHITLFPQGAFGPSTVDARPVASVLLKPDESVQKDPLFAQILHRHTNRGTYDLSRAVPAAAWQAMETAAGPAIRVGYAGLEQGAALQEHRRIARDAWRIELTVPRTIMESFKVLRVGASEIAAHRDGISLTDPVVVAMDRLGLFDRSRAPGPDDYATTSQVKSFDDKLASTPGFMWMVSADNRRVTQVQAGRAYARLQLAATAAGLAMQPLQQALQEYPEQQQPYAAIHALAGATQPGATVQMWARVGYAPAVEPAPRRRLQDFIKKG